MSESLAKTEQNVEVIDKINLLKINILIVFIRHQSITQLFRKES